jgi:hypothetical protein
MFIPSTLFPISPDPATRQPYTAAATFPLFACHYVLAVLAILPHTYVLRLALAPVVVAQAWNCAVGLDFSAGMAKSLGRHGESAARLNHWNFAYVVRNPFFFLNRSRVFG